VTGSAVGVRDSSNVVVMTVETVETDVTGTVPVEGETTTVDNDVTTEVAVVLPPVRQVRSVIHKDTVSVTVAVTVPVPVGSDVAVVLPSVSDESSEDMGGIDMEDATEDGDAPGVVEGVVVSMVDEVLRKRR
jgi:hypothetical protein